MSADLITLAVERGSEGTGDDAVQIQQRLLFDGQSGNFTVGLTITGGTSGATGVIVAQTDGGTSGQLLLKEVSGEFIGDEEITDTDTGVADVVGALNVGSAYNGYAPPGSTLLVSFEASEWDKAELLEALERVKARIRAMDWPQE